MILLVFIFSICRSCPWLLKWYYQYRAFVFCMSCLLFSHASVAVAEPVKIVFWHSLAGNLGKEVMKIADAFNRSQNEYYIRPLYKGDYNECLTSLAAAFRAGQAPALVQIFEVGTPTMLAPEGIIKPVGSLMEEHGISLPKSSFFPAVVDYYSEADQLMAMPFNTSIPVMFYNRDALADLGYFDDDFPVTWDEFEVLARKLKQSGFDCAYTTANPAWILIESFSALHGLPVIDSKHFLAQYNNPTLIRYLERIKRWQQQHLFEYGGRTDDSSVLFTSGRCPIYSQSSGSYNSLKEMVPFELGVASIPADTNQSEKRYRNISGGAALWVIQGHCDKIYKGAAKFISFLANPTVQSNWHQNTGYLPLGITGLYEAVALQSNHPSLRLARRDLTASEHANAGLSFRVQNQIRVINDEALEAVFAGLKTPKQAMDDAVSRANHALLRFRRNTKG